MRSIAGQRGPARSYRPVHRLLGQAERIEAPGTSVNTARRWSARSGSAAPAA